MKILEIIHLRSAGEPLESLSLAIKESIGVESAPDRVITVFRRKGLETDIAVHIEFPATSEISEPSGLGVQLASALRAYGLVEHTVWEELS